MANSLSKNYAEALFSLGNDENNLLLLQDQMKQLKQIILENDEFISYLKSYLVSKNEKEKFIKESLHDFDDNIVSLVLILNTNHRISYLLNVIDEFNSLCNEKRGILEGLVYSTYPLKENEILKIEEAISSKENVKCELKNLIDSSLIGGIKVVINTHVYDGSILNRIESIKKSLI